MSKTGKFKGPPNIHVVSHNRCHGLWSLRLVFASDRVIVGVVIRSVE